MPSLPHEAIVELFRNRPVLAAELLAEVFSVPLPKFTEARVESADLADVIPRELRADLLVLLLDGEAVLVIIVEAQLSANPDKSFAWPAYVVGARARYRCPACLLVVTHDAALAARLARPIEIGPGDARITPFVLGPKGIPVVREVSQARERPELAVLSAMAHGNTETGLDIAVAALMASAGVEDEDRKTLYADLVLFSLGEAARRALEELMAIPNYEYRSEFAREYIEKGAVKLIAHQFDCRLGRALTNEERTTLAMRVHEQGFERVGELVLKLPVDELARFVAPNNGH